MTLALGIFSSLMFLQYTDVLQESWFEFFENYSTYLLYCAFQSLSNDRERCRRHLNPGTKGSVQRMTMFLFSFSPPLCKAFDCYSIIQKHLA